MKVFGFEIRKFETSPTTMKAVETWCVKWPSLHKMFSDRGEVVVNVLGFPSEAGAREYAKELQDARALLGDKGFGAEVYVQKTHTNA